MAQFIDDVEEVLEDTLETASLDDEEVAEDDEDVDAGSDEEVVEQDPVVDARQPASLEDLPEKYRNKSIKEVIAMHQESERLIGKQGNEVGELRRAVDDLIKLQTTRTVSAPEAEDTDLDFYDEPARAVNKAIEAHPAIKEAQNTTRILNQQNVRQQLMAKYPDFVAIASSPEFNSWAQSSPVRQEIYNRATNGFDFDSADELISSWKERQVISKKLAETSRQERREKLRSADVGVQGTTESTSKKIYRRGDIRNLILTNPEKYDAMSEELAQAYRENRVVN